MQASSIVPDLFRQLQATGTSAAADLYGAQGAEPFKDFLTLFSQQLVQLSKPAAGETSAQTRSEQPAAPQAETSTATAVSEQIAENDPQTQAPIRSAAPQAPRAAAAAQTSPKDTAKTAAANEAAKTEEAKDTEETGTTDEATQATDPMATLLQQLAALMAQFQKALENSGNASVSPDTLGALKEKFTALLQQVQQLLQTRAQADGDGSPASRLLKLFQSFMAQQQAQNSGVDPEAAAADSQALAAEAQVQIEAAAQTAAPAASGAASAVPAQTMAQQQAAAAAKPGAGKAPAPAQTAGQDATARQAAAAAPSVQTPAVPNTDSDLKPAQASLKEKTAAATAPNTGAAQAAQTATDSTATAQSIGQTIQDINDLLARINTQGQTAAARTPQAVPQTTALATPAAAAAVQMSETLKAAVAVMFNTLPDETAAQDKKAQGGTLLTFIRTQLDAMRETISRVFGSQQTQGQTGHETGTGANGANSSAAQTAARTSGTASFADLAHAAGQTPYTSQASDQPVVSQVLQSIRVAVASGRMEAQIQLDPPSLGHVTVQLNMDGDHLVARIQADNDTTRQIIERNIDQLKSSLTAAGFNVDGCEVSLRDSSSDQSATPQNRGTSGRNLFSSSKGNEEDGAAADPTQTTTQDAGGLLSATGHINVLI